MATTYLPASPGTPVQRRSRGSADNLPVYLAVAMGYVLLVPPQFNITVGTTLLPVYRFMLIPAVLYVMGSALRGRIRFNWIDWSIIAATAWIALALFMTTEATEAFTAVVAQTTDIAFAYFFGRYTIRSVRDLRMFLIFMAPALLVLGLILIAESLTHQRLLQQVAGAITGKNVAYGIDLRLGLFRAPGPFPHPILAGVFLASFLPLYALVGLRNWPKVVGIIAAYCSFFTVSSAALLGLVLVSGLIAYNWLSERITNISWRLFFFFTAVFIFFAETATGSGSVGLIMRFGSLNSHSSFWRALIWDYGTKNVAANPWFGLGYKDWVRPIWMQTNSVDHFWLLIAMRFGILPAALLALATTLAVFQLMRAASQAGYHDRRALIGVAMSLAIFAISIISVALWLSAHIWFFMLLGLAATLARSAGDDQRLPATVGASRLVRDPSFLRKVS